MKKIQPFALCLAAILLAGCTQDVEPTSSVLPIPPESSAKSSEAPAEDYSIVTKDNGLVAPSGTYSYSVAEEGDSYPPEIEIDFSSNWAENYVTALDDRKTLIKSENADVIPVDAVTYTPIYRKNSNLIAGMRVTIDRSKIKVGQTHLKLACYPSNGNTTLNKLTALSLGFTITEYGKLGTKTHDVVLTIKNVAKFSTLFTKHAEATSLRFQMWGPTDNSLYGTTAVNIESWELGKDALTDTWSLGTLHLSPLTYTTSFRLYDANGEYLRDTDVMVKADSGAGYEIKEDASILSSSLTVNQDLTLSIEADL